MLQSGQEGSDEIGSDGVERNIVQGGGPRGSSS